MSAELPVLDRVRVASPCHASWEAMHGDDRARFCSECRKHVYNLSGMTRAEAEALVREREGDLCVRFHRRRDGTLLTADCPVGRWRLRRALIVQVGLLACVFLAIPGVASGLDRARWKDWPLWDDDPYHSVAVKLGIRPERIVMGRMVAPPFPPGPQLKECLTRTSPGPAFALGDSMKETGHSHERRIHEPVRPAGP